ncbi:MAG: T9SS type A sorting domain-containing protein [Flavobacteriales bacterium]
MKHAFLFFFFTFFSLTVFAQDPCDDLNVLSIQYSPFTDTVVYVQVENNSSELFDYPGFVLINSAGDTVAKERTDFFVIGQESIHPLNVWSGVQDPLANFEGNLELHTGFYSEMACSWAVNQSLCADEPCDSLFIGLENYGGALVTGNFEWVVEDETENVIETGTFTMEATNQSWKYGLCLTPGNYIYTLNALTTASGGGPTLTVSNTRSYSGPTMSTSLDWFNDPSGEIEFPFFPFCSASPSGVNSELSGTDLPTLSFNSNYNQLNCTEPMSEVKLYSTLGVLVARVSNSGKSLIIPKLPKGVYLVSATTEKGEVTARFALK